MGAVTRLFALAAKLAQRSSPVPLSLLTLPSWAHPPHPLLCRSVLGPSRVQREDNLTGPQDCVLGPSTVLQGDSTGHLGHPTCGRILAQLWTWGKKSPQWGH